MICFATLSICIAMTCKRLFLLELLSSQRPRNVPHYYDRINKGFEAACSWLEQLRTDYGDYLGRVGSTNFVQQVVSDCSTCFDWDYFLEQQGPFQSGHRDAFMRLFQSLLPQLQQTTAWPDPEDFPYVERQWFPQSKRVGVEFFYLVRRLQKEYPNRPDWKEIIGYHVEPVKIPAGGRASGLLKFFPSTVVYLIYGYLEGHSMSKQNRCASLALLQLPVVPGSRQATIVVDIGLPSRPMQS